MKEKAQQENNFKEYISKNFDSLFHEYYARLSMYANTYVRDMETSKELVQDFFVKLYEQRGQITINTSLKSYMYKSVYHSCLNHIKHESMKNRHKPSIQESYNTVSDYTFEEITTNELEEKLFRAIEALPKKCKKIFKMNRFEGKSNTEIAEELGISKRTVETQISIALKNLRQKCARYLN